MSNSDTVLLVDYQNVRDSGLQGLPDHRRLVLFVGKGQKPKADFVQDSMKRGARLDLVPITEDGNNNLDFHLAFYLGRLMAEEPYAEFVIVSNDKDFAPLIKHVQSLGVPCEQRGTLRNKPAVKAPAPRAKLPAPAPKPALAKPKPAALKAKQAAPAPQNKPAPPAAPDIVTEATAFLKRAGSRRPKTIKKLSHSLANFFHVSEHEADRLVDNLIGKGTASISNNGVVTYKF